MLEYSLFHKLDSAAFYKCKMITRKYSDYAIAYDGYELSVVDRLNVAMAAACVQRVYR